MEGSGGCVRGGSHVSRKAEESYSGKMARNKQASSATGLFVVLGTLLTYLLACMLWYARVIKLRSPVKLKLT